MHTQTHTHTHTHTHTIDNIRILRNVYVVYIVYANAHISTHTRVCTFTCTQTTYQKPKVMGMK